MNESMFLKKMKDVNEHATPSPAGYKVQKVREEWEKRCKVDQKEY